MDMSKGSVGAAVNLMPTGSQRWVQQALQASIDTTLDVVGMEDDRGAARDSQAQKERPQQQQQQQQQQLAYAPQAAARPGARITPPGNGRSTGYAPQLAGSYGEMPARDSSAAGSVVSNSGLNRLK